MSFLTFHSKNFCIIIFPLLLILVSCSDSDDDYDIVSSMCPDALLEYEKTRNQTLPIKIDAITEWVSFTLDCKYKTATSIKKITIDYRDITPAINLNEWRVHQQRMHTMHNCNPNEGLSGAFGWSTVDNVVDYNGFLFSLMTNPDDCN